MNIRITILISSVLCTVSLPVFGQFYKNFSKEEKKAVAEAYYLVGKQFESLKIKNSETYIRLAYLIYPELDPANIREDYGEVTSSEDTGPAQSTYQRNAKLVRYRFQRLVAFFLAKDVTTLGDYFDEQVYDSDFDLFISRAELQEGLNKVFEYLSTSGLTAESLFKMRYIEISPVKSPLADDLILELKVQANSLDFQKFFSFWHEEQKYYWHQDVQGKWVVFALNRIPVSEEYFSRRKATLLDKEITTAIKSCLAAFVKEDLSGVSPYLGEEIEILPLNTTLKKTEMEYTFTGYFEESQKLNIGNIDDLLSGLTISADREYSNKKGADVYRVEITFNSQYLPQISFWAAYKKYYLIKQKSIWKIIAIS